MEVRGLGQISGATQVGRTAPVSAPQSAAPAGGVAPQHDEVEISSAARQLDSAGPAAGVREQRLDQIKAAIAAGTYETPEKLQMAVDRMLQQLALDQAADG
ncbi:MAG: flagellar biosynthesis anti-sigma factor FlgM [Planctomycetaceae bacterium]|nr:MAG: flagellar biosynthesis anti-sigma factor FlgM [Planctomycetaceae bacterium]